MTNVNDWIISMDTYSILEICIYIQLEYVYILYVYILNVKIHSMSRNNFF